jgi:hypothetical protein
MSIKTSYILKHENYNENIIRNDIALIKLDTKVKKSRNVSFVCLTPNIPIIADEIVLVAGNLNLYKVFLI